MLRRLCEGLSPEPLRLRPSPGLFSPLETARHLRDIEREGYLVRIEQVLSRQAPVLGSLEGDPMALERRYAERELRSALEGFSVARAASLRLLGCVVTGGWTRPATFEGRTLSLATLVEMMAEHDRGHLLSLQSVHIAALAA